MLRGTKVGLRARRPEDVEILQTEMHDDVSVQVRSDPRPWRPTPVEHSGFAVKEPDERMAVFSVVELVEGEPLAGTAVLWNIDTHNQSAHLGLGLRPAFRGRALGSDIVRVLCHYGFVVCNLNRLQIETLADNAAMIGAATASGFRHEGTRRDVGWVEGMFLDEVIYGLLRSEWAENRAGAVS